MTDERQTAIHPAADGYLQPVEGLPHSGWNPRYVRYAQAHGRSPIVQRGVDAIEWPGGINAGFMLWIQSRWREWRELTGRKAGEPMSENDHDAFDTWLDTWRPGG